VIHAR